MFDLDGTVLDRNRDMTPRTVHAFERAHASGRTVAVSSGRAASMVPSSVKALPFIDYLITSNGACIRRIADGIILHHACLNRHTVQEVLSAVKGKKVSLNVFFEDRAIFEIKGFSYMLAGAKRFSREDLKRLNEMRRRIRNVFLVSRELQRNQTPIEKMGCNFRTYTDSEDVLRALDMYSDIEAVHALGNELEITAHGVSKGISLGVLCKSLHINVSDVVAFGDSGNDLSMKEYAGCFVAMGNATPDVKAAADFITGAVTENGVAHWLKQYLEV